MSELETVAIIIAIGLVLNGLLRAVTGRAYIPGYFRLNHEHDWNSFKTLKIEITHKADEEMLRLLRQLILKVSQRK